MPSTPESGYSRDEIRALEQKVGELIRTANGVFTELLELSELSQRNPEYYGKLLEVVYSRTSEIGEHLNMVDAQISVLVKKSQ